jgi:selenophosphate synthetase-related protein
MESTILGTVLANANNAVAAGGRPPLAGDVVSFMVPE